MHSRVAFFNALLGLNHILAFSLKILVRLCPSVLVSFPWSFNFRAAHSNTTHRILTALCSTRSARCASRTRSTTSGRRT
jgi:hypothetical protein